MQAMKLRKFTAFCLSVLLLPYQIVAQQPTTKKFELTIDNIMRGPELVGHAPMDMRWSQDSQRVYFRWKQANEPRLKEFDWYMVGRDGSGLKKLSEDEAKLTLSPLGELSKDKTWTLFTEDGDIFLFDHAKNERRQLTKTTDIESNPHLTLDQKRIYFTRQNNLYVLPLDSGTLTQITDIRSGGAVPSVAAFGGFGGGGAARQSGGAGEQQKGTDSQEFIKKEERELLEAVRERAQQREEQEAKRKKRETRRPFNVSPGQSVGSLILTPDENYVIATVFEPGTGTKNSIVPNYITESAYTEDIPARNKVGDNPSRSRMAVINAETGEVKFVDHDLKAEAKIPSSPQPATPPATLPNAAQQRDGQAQLRQTERQADRQVQLSALAWSEDGKNAVLQARAADNKDRWVMQLDPATAKTKILFTEHDDAWIGGPGSFTLGWLPDNKRVYFVTERDDFAHLYTMAVDSGEPKQLTTGKWEVASVEIAPDKAKFYLTTSEVSSSERHYYAMSFDGGARTKLTSMPGNNQVEVSPDESMQALIRSYSNKPPELYLVPNKPGVEAKQITTSPPPEFFSYNWVDPPIVNVKARDGADVPARIYKPKNYQRGGPAVVFVHGAGYLQNVHKGWSSYYREYMFHHLLMERGYLVLDIDYRASAGYGRDWRTGIYRHMGGKDLSDHIDS